MVALLLAKGALSKPLAENLLAKYGDPLHSAGLSGCSLEGRDWVDGVSHLT